MRDEIELPRQVALDADGRVAEDLPCIRCEYNLRTLHEEAKCPECGTDVSLSIRGNWLKYSDPGWLTRMARGLELTSWMVTVPVGLMILVMIADPWRRR
jgi:hypothetical protein